MNHTDYIEKASRDYSSFDEAREAAENDVQFAMIDGGHWNNWSRSIDSRFNGRAKLQLDFVTQAHNRHMGEYASNRIDAKYSPDDDATTEESAQLLQGVYRRDFRRGGGQIAQDNAKYSQSLCGVGAWRLVTEYENPEDPEDIKQRIAFKGIDSAHNTVVWDVGAKEIDKSDARHVSLIEEFDRGTLESEYPDAVNIASALAPGSIQTRRTYSNLKDAVFILTHYELKRKKVKKQVFVHQETRQKQFIDADEVELIQAELEDQGFEFVREKKIIEQWVEKSVVHGNGFLEEPRRIAGKLLPIIPAYGYRGYSDGREYYFGLVRKKKDAQRLFDMMMSGIAEVAGAKANTIPMMDPERIRGYEPVWNGNLANKNWLPLKPILDQNGVPIHAPAEFLPPPQVDPNMALMADITSSYLREQNGGSFADVKDTEMSGKAIQTIMKRQDMDSKPLNDNFRVAVKRAAEVYASMAQDVYGISRSIKTVEYDGSEKVVQLMKQVVDDSGDLQYINDLSTGKFEVVIEAGVGYDTMREEGVENIRALLQSILPENKYYDPLMALLIDSFGDAGFEDIKEFNRKEMIKMGLKEPENEEDQQVVAEASQPTESDKMNEAILKGMLSEAKNNDAAAAQKLADAQKKIAERMKIQNEIGVTTQRLGMDAVASDFDRKTRLRQAAGLH